MRIDLYLYKNGYTRSRQKAQELITAGGVTVDGHTVTKSSFDVNEALPHTITIKETCPYVGRGGLKLEAAFRAFSIFPKGAVAADIGASTGGFTDCLLKNGAQRVYAIDAGFDQLAPSLKSDDRVISIEHFNARALTRDTLGEPCDLAVMDVSFISQTLILPGVTAILKSGGKLISLIKPQFEAGKSAIGKNGIVRNEAYRFLAVRRVLHAAEELGLLPTGLIRSPIKGGDGNTEYLAAFEFRGAPITVSPYTDLQIQRITSRTDG